MGNMSTSGYVFNYTEMMRLGIVNLPSEALNTIQSEMEFENPKRHRVITNSKQEDPNQGQFNMQ
jgi:hypothetical protein